jgi:hypothetical protein
MIRQELTQLLLDAIVLANEDLHGPLVGRVEKYESSPPAPPTVDVQPVVQLLYDGEYQTAPKMQGVPVAWPGGTNYRITWPIEVGDNVELRPLGRDHGKWLASGAEGQPPQFDRVLSLSDVVAHPTPPWSAAVPVPATSTASDGMVLLAPKLYLGGSDATLAVSLNGDKCPADTPMATWMGQVETAINVLAPGSITPLSTTFASVAIAFIKAVSTVLKGK